MLSCVLCWGCSTKMLCCALWRNTASPVDMLCSGSIILETSLVLLEICQFACVYCTSYCRRCCKGVRIWYSWCLFLFLSGSSPSGPSSGVTSPALIPIPSHSVPDFSYSSSEDEFYDADEFYQSSTSPKHCIEWVPGPPPPLFYQHCINKIKLGANKV